MDEASGSSVGAEFRRRKRRQVTLLILGLPFLAFLGWSKVFPERLDNAVAGACAALALGYIAIAIVFSLRNWRCPRCEGWLGNELSPAYCRRCGAGFGS